MANFSSIMHNFFFLIEMFIDLYVTSPANPGDYRLVLIWLVKVKPLPALTIRITLVQMTDNISYYAVPSTIGV
jgi:hypothetical protein